MVKWSHIFHYFKKFPRKKQEMIRTESSISEAQLKEKKELANFDKFLEEFNNLLHSKQKDGLDYDSRRIELLHDLSTSALNAYSTQRKLKLKRKPRLNEETLTKKYEQYMKDARGNIELSKEMFQEKYCN